ncbi:MAG: MOSC domain-containing protein [Coriobacteriales bacterium]|nr:MOSC domain-containing protein [Coriobacteriales bacterium]
MGDTKNTPSPTENVPAESPAHGSVTVPTTLPDPPPRGRIRSINTSVRKGTRKTPLAQGSVRIALASGLEGDAHAGSWHRQVSFLAEESIARAREMGLDVKEGDFAENFTTEGIELYSLPVGTVFKLGDTEVEISQIGKVCHTRCAIYHLAGDCIFPREGIFGVVRKEGTVRVGDEMSVLEWGTGSCEATPPEALAEVDAARKAGTL